MENFPQQTVENGGDKREKGEMRRVCAICGLTWCVSACPNYEPERDPMAEGRCEQCGTVLFAAGAVLCERCEAKTHEKDDV